MIGQIKYYCIAGSILVLTMAITCRRPQQDVVYKDSSITKFFEREHGWIASDGAFSVPLNNGKVLWLMGDSYIGHYDTATRTVPCLFQVRNAALLQPSGDWQWTNTATLTGGKESVQSLFRNTEDNDYMIWPGSGVQLGDTVYVYGANMKMTGTGSLSFESGGNDFMMKMLMPSMQVVDYDILQEMNGIMFGLGMHRETDGFVYVWGYKPAYISSDVFVARFPVSHPSGPWYFWDGTTWNTDPEKSKKIGQGASNGVYVTKVRNKYVMASTEFSVGCDMGNKVFTAVSDHITGPFSERKAVWTLDDTLQGHYPFFYTPAIHPEYINDKDEILITYCINGYGECIDLCRENRFDPRYYRPQGIRVPLQVIDPDWQ